MPDRIIVRPLMESDLDMADRIMRLAFGTFNNLDNPLSYLGDGDYVHTRWRREPDAAIALEVDGRLVGSNFATRWGSFAYFGPLSIEPAYWGHGLAGHLMAPVMEMFDRWQVAHAGLFTFPHSVKHIGLYQKFGFRPRMLTLILEKTLSPRVETEDEPAWNTYGQLDAAVQVSVRNACRSLTEGLYPGLDVTPEIESVFRQRLGDTVLLWEGDALAGFAVCHSGAGSEAGSNNCYIKFGAAVPGGAAPDRFARLLISVEAFARCVGAGRMVAGVNCARGEAYEAILASGYCLFRSGIAMHRPNQSGHCRPGIFVIDDWR